MIIKPSYGNLRGIIYYYERLDRKKCFIPMRATQKCNKSTLESKHFVECF